MRFEFKIKKTRIVNLQVKNGEQPPFDVYIGRMVEHTDFTENSIWHNPYPIETYGKRSLILYERDLRKNKGLMKKLPDLRNKTLGCWCINTSSSKNPRCHGQIILKIMEEQGII